MKIKCGRESRTDFSPIGAENKQNVSERGAEFFTESQF